MEDEETEFGGENCCRLPRAIRPTTTAGSVSAMAQLCEPWSPECPVPLRTVFTTMFGRWQSAPGSPWP